ncbi:ABC transporter ATP-binding protein [Papillibacter cinnamivorans]|uniref:ABC-2 type transport system ATP-binding protein n=1 Tax=Papillibacter cinnamivorans DSM 12816 TaxID=1122930 RepID=A0A1W1YWX5_9FIRM|nr:ATP-binding cassette domain-containing protein [Papillibacter cinnamivorans]SMC40710.1 ABC-2 type transport system ATP-binding protein [Papillibacter cinnamivorans DSM 12816]
MKAIETLGLTKRYGAKTAVDGLNLEIERGELFALLGVNGAGKTTTIKMISGLTKPTGGDARILGYSIVSEPIRVKERINVSPQETATAPNLTVRENLELIAGIYGESRERSRRKAEEMISAFGLGEFAHVRSKTLSGGLMRRLSIAMALISEPEVLFLDEPTLGLDVIARRELWAAIEKLKGRVTMILTTHYMEEAEALSDRVGVMAGGRLKAVGTAGELTERTKAKNFEDAFIALAEGEG